MATAELIEQKAYSDSYSKFIEEIIASEFLALRRGRIRQATPEENYYKSWDLVALDELKEIDGGAFGTITAQKVGCAGLHGTTIGYRNRREQFFDAFIPTLMTLRIGRGEGQRPSDAIEQYAFQWEMKKVLQDGLLRYYFFGLTDDAETGKYLWYKIIDVDKVRAHVNWVRSTGKGLIAANHGRWFSSSDNRFFVLYQAAFPRNVIVAERCARKLLQLALPIDMFGNKRSDVALPKGIPSDVLDLDFDDSVNVAGRDYLRVIRHVSTPVTLANFQSKIAAARAKKQPLTGSDMFGNYHE